MTQGALLQWDEPLGSQRLQAAGRRLVPHVKNASAELLQVMSAQRSTCSPLCQQGRLIEEALVQLSLCHLE